MLATTENYLIVSDFFVEALHNFTAYLFYEKISKYLHERNKSDIL